ncbi:hypothetical protein ACH5RR_017932 [Cinchona calisaya]|uniref:Dof zinc finger protein n=1 Tax=Cinchona calisaya TaxID=153742 RepID=A0ABD2ZQ12_9GENT
MLGNCEKMVSSSTTNEWTQLPQIDEKELMDHSTETKMMMEKTNQEQQQQQQPALKCPRCNSSNTKFCYYNNYSLSQPRHFCKACKRYWTRGGTLRNVPVGGGCRKNKRVTKRPVSASTNETATSKPSHQIDLSSTSSAAANHISPLFYSLLTNNHPSSELNLPYSNGFDHLQPQMNGLGIGFSSSGILASAIDVNGISSISSNNQPLIHQDVGIPSNPLFSSYHSNNPIFGSTSTTSTMASLIASSIQQQKMVFGGGFEGFDDMQMQPSKNDEGSFVVKDVKMEEGHHRLDWNVANNQMNSSDPSLLWNTTGVSAWLDPSNVGSSVPSLI